MGLESNCVLERSDGEWPGHARLEHTHLWFRGGVRLSLPLRELTVVSSNRDRLTLQHGGELITLRLGKNAAAWALKIRYPRSRSEKLGLTTGLKVLVFSVSDDVFEKELALAGCEVRAGTGHSTVDMIFVGIGQMNDLQRLGALRRRMKPAAALWVLWRKGQPQLTETHVRKAARQHGLVDVKVISFSETHSGLKLMIPRHLRKDGAPL